MACGSQDPNNPERWEEALDEFARRARGLLGDKLSRIILYGSRARGDATPESDVDILVLLKNGEDERAAYDLIFPVAFEIDTEYSFDPWLQVLIYTEESFLRRASYFMIKDVKAEGVVVE